MSSGKVPSDIKQTFQSQLESVGVPVSAAKQATDILAVEFENPNHKRTPEQQKVISDAYTWFAAKQRS